VILSKEIKDYIIENTRGCYDGYMLLIKNLADKLNIKIFEAEFADQKLSGQIEGKNGTFIIYVNKKHPISRKRFTVAHEIGHYISYINESFSKTGWENKGGYEDYISYNRTLDLYSKELLKCRSRSKSNRSRNVNERRSCKRVDEAKSYA
jgi:hypothetical protein